MTGVQTCALPISRHEGRLKGKPVLARTQMAAPGELAEKAHLTVLLNSPVLIAYAEEHLTEIRQRFLQMVPSSDVEMKEHTKNYAKWLKKRLAQGSIDDIATWLAQKPSPTVLTYQAYAIIWFANSTRFVDESPVPTKPRPRSESCFLIGQNPNPMDCTSAPLDAPRSNGDPHPFRRHMQFRL